MESVKSENIEANTDAALRAWAGWYEGEEGWPRPL